MLRRSTGSAACALFVAGLLSAGVAAVAGDDEQSGETDMKHVKILAIGNSFSGNATKYLADIVKSSGKNKLTFGHACIGGCPLEKHYNLAMLHEKNPDDPEGMPYTHGKKKMGLKEMLTAEQWQYVTIQQYSMHSFKIDTYRPSAKQLCEYIKTYAPQAEIVFHQTWAYRSDDKETYKKGYSQEKMYKDLTTAYHTIADEVGIKRIIPVGDAFQLAEESPDWRFVADKDFNFKEPVYPQLPKELHSLHAGFNWRVEGEKKTLGSDTHHANMAGEYLGGCVWLEFFFGGDVTKVKYKPAKLSENDAAFLRETAHNVMTGGVKPAAWPLATKTK